MEVVKDHPLIFPELSPEDRIQTLTDSAESVTEEFYYKSLSGEELTEERRQYAEKMTEYRKLEQELKDIKQRYKLQMDPIKADAGQILETIKFKKKLMKGKLWNLANFDLRMMDTYNEFGELVNSRRLTPEENQPRLFIQGPRPNQ